MALHPHESDTRSEHARVSIRPQFSIGGEPTDIPRFRIPDAPLAPETAYQVVHDELMLDGNARLNLATFVSTWMDPQADRLMAECVSKNMIDKDEYPQTAELERRCVNILASLWNAPGSGEATGCSTTGSSEASMLGGLAMKWRWRAAREADGKPTDKPNLVMGANVQVCWEKFCRYWDVEMRLVPVSLEATHLTADTAVAHCDENTIGVVAVLGSTYDGTYEPVADIVAALDALQERTGFDIPVHVDGASGGMIAPFIDPDLSWDFRLGRVKSINTSGHKYGLVYPGVGWVVWRDAESLPKDLVFEVNYLGGKMPTFALNFSRPGAQVVAQYYMLLRLGFEGYRSVQQASRDTAMWLAGQLKELDPFELVSQGDAVPVVTFRLGADEPYTVFDLSEALRGRGWIVPAYTMPPAIEDTSVLRIVVRNDFSGDLASMLMGDIKAEVARLSHGEASGHPSSATGGFHH